MSIRFVKVCPNEFINESRDKREISVCKNMGMDIYIVAKGNSNSKEWDKENGWNIYRCTTRPLGKKIPASINRFISLFTWALTVKKISPSIISGHDLIGVYIGWISSLFFGKKCKPRLVYDAHEFEIGRNAKRGKFQKNIIRILEGYIIKRSCFTIVVNDLIADELQRIYKLKQRPIVVRNIPEKWEVDLMICKKMKDKIIKEFTNGKSNTKENS